MSSDKERKKLLTDKQQAIVDIVVTAIEALVVVVCIVVSVLVWVGVSDPADRNLNWFAIQTNSMVGDNPDSMNPGDLMFTKKVKSINDLKATERDADGNIVQLGDVVVFKMSIYDEVKRVWVEDQIVTHRIVEIDYAQNRITTQGDHNPVPDNGTRPFEDIIGVYTNKWKGVGKVTLWLGGFKKVTDGDEVIGYTRDGGSTATFLVIIIPLALLFVYNGYVVIKWTMDERAKKIRAAAMAEAENNTQSQDEIKHAAIVEFLKSNGMTDEQIAAYFAEKEAAAQSAPVEDAPAAETPKEEAPAETAETADESADAPQE